MGRPREEFLPLPVDRTIELRWDLDHRFDGTFPPLGFVDGARVKPVVYVPEEKVELVQREALREWLLAQGAVYVKSPTVHVVRQKTRRDERHAVEVSLEESIRMFAEEVKPRDSEERIAYAVALAREADAGG